MTMTTDYILHKELEKVLDLLTPGNRLAMEVAMATGLRITDVLSLKREKLGRQFWIVEQKTGKKRRVNLGRDLLGRLLAHSEGSVWAFPGRDKRKHRTRQTVWKDVKRAQRAFRLVENLGTHTARKVYAVEMFARYGDIARVRRALNHNSAEVTALYAMADVLTCRRIAKRKSGRA
jgi:site-specific recombinase XerD